MQNAIVNRTAYGQIRILQLIVECHCRSDLDPHSFRTDPVELYSYLDLKMTALLL